MRACLLTGALFIAVLAVAQNTAPRPIPPPQPAMGEPIFVSENGVVPEGYSIELFPETRIRPSKLQEGELVHFSLHQDLYYGDVLLARSGTVVEALVTEVQGAKAWGRPSKLGLEFGRLLLVNGKYLSLRAQRFDAPERTETPMAGAIAAPVPGAFIVGIPLALVGAASKGKTIELSVDEPVPVTTDEEFAFDLESFRAFQPTHPQPAKLRVVYERLTPYEDDLYCNGVPIAHLKKFHRAEFALEPGYYRFALVMKGDSTLRMLPLHVNPNGEVNLVGGALNLRALDPDRKAWEGTGWFSHLTDAQLMRQAKPIERRDLYPTTCQPLQEVHLMLRWWMR